MIAKIGRMLPALLAFGGFASIASDVQAQGNTFNPYGNSGYADYREFGNPMVSNNPALPGQAVLNSTPLIGRPRANSYQQFSDELDGIDTTATAGRRNSNLPYYQAYQQLNSRYNRVYQPNNTEADRRFYESMKKRDQDYAKALREPDPVKRAKLLRQIELDAINRPASKTASTKGATAPKPSANGSTTARSAAPPEPRVPAPAPPLSPPARRPSSNLPSTRTPASTSRPGTTVNRAIPDPSTIPTPAPR